MHRGPAHRASGSAAHSAGILVSDTRGFITELYARIANPFTPPTPHEDICGRCARASSCPALGKAVVKTAEGMGLPLPSVFAPGRHDLRARPVHRALPRRHIRELGQAGQARKRRVRRSRGHGARIQAYAEVFGALCPQKDRTKAAMGAVGDAGLRNNVEDVLGCSLVVGDLVAAVALRKGVPEKTAKEMVRQALAEHASEASPFLSKEKRVADETLLGQSGLGIAWRIKSKRRKR